MWNELPEWSWDMPPGRYPGNGASLPARTALHGSLAGRAWKKQFGRGDDWYDWDANMFHFIGGEPKNGSMSSYVPHTLDHYMDAYLARHARGPETGSV